MSILVSVLAVLVGGWWGVTRVIIPMQLTSKAPATSAPLDYSVPGHWLHRPETPPPPVWEAGWEIDFFVIPPAPQRLSSHGIVDPMDEDLRADQLSASTALIDALSDHGAVYMPSLRWPSPIADPPADLDATSADVLTSFETYLDTDNQGRAVIFVVQDNADDVLVEVSEAIGTRLLDVQSRVGGIAFVGSPISDHYADFRWPRLCSSALGINCAFVISADPSTSFWASLLPQKPSLIANMEFWDADAPSYIVESHTRVILADLENNVAKTAEPLGELTFVDAPEIRRPGEVDEEQPDQN